MRTAALGRQFPLVLNVSAGRHEISPEMAQTIGSAIRSAAAAGEIDWLAPAQAFDIPFAGDPDAVRAALRNVNDEWLLDVNVVSGTNRRKKLLVADMDSTIICCECIDELADMAGIKPKVATITERAMRGEIDFPAALRERVALLQGLPVRELDRVYRERVRLNPGARIMAATMRAHGARSLLVSGGFTYFTSRVAVDAGFQENQGNSLLDDGAILTGKVGEPILGREAKLKAVEDAVARFGIAFDDALAIGDGANDLEMIRRAGMGVAYHARPVVAAAAGCSISHGDLTTVLYLQGYRAEEFVSP
ncbi:MAG TPA: phosphoserine phosphatase SerB [Micropepsaceae bacterium]|nr:phosphoserine phosphatase SerB [Micropepsaceae bacterium]